MKKRVKLIAVVSSFCLCLSLFVMGIFAATSVTFSVTSSLSFKANGAFVKVVAELRQGATADGATLQSGAPDTYQYTGYSYNRESGSDVPDGSATPSSLPLVAIPSAREIPCWADSAVSIPL